MSRRLQMLQVARLAQRSLGEAADLVVAFLQQLALPDGSYANRDGKSDLYYTSFALDALAALDRQPDNAQQTRHWLEGFGDGRSLDFVHRCCLARAWAAQPAGSLPAGRGEAIAQRVLENRARDGGYATREDAYAGTAYGCFLAVNARGTSPCFSPKRECAGHLQLIRVVNQSIFSDAAGSKIHLPKLYCGLWFA